MDEFDVCMDEETVNIAPAIDNGAGKNISRQLYLLHLIANAIERTHTSGPLKGKKKMDLGMEI